MKFPQTVEECAFEPDSVEIRCVDCNKATGVMGTCRDVGFCADCRAGYIAAAIAQGESQQEAETGFSEMVITMIEGHGYRAKFKPRRVLHLSVDDMPACGARGGPHPLTTNRHEANCKRCVTRWRG